MCRTGLCRYGFGNWIFLVLGFHLFTYIQGIEKPIDVPKFTQEPWDVVAAEGSRVLLPCSAGGSPRMALRWAHAHHKPTRDHVLAHHDPHRKQLPNGSLVIESMSAATAGQYQCLVTVDGLGTMVSRVATVFLAEVPDLQPGPRSILGVVGSPVLLPCRTASHPLPVLNIQPDAERRFYPPQRLQLPVLDLNVTWLKNGLPVHFEDSRLSIIPGGALEIDPLNHHDQGTYSCRMALLADSSKFKTSTSIELRVSTEDTGLESPPRFIASPVDATVVEGASVTFECAAVGNPKPEIIWLNNGVVIDLNSLDSRVRGGVTGWARVSNTRPSDSGAYTCRSTNAVDASDSLAKLTVLSPPRVSIPNGPVVTTLARSDLTLRCEVRGRPSPSVLWLKDGETMSPNQHDIMIVDQTSLRILGVLKVDSGIFQCVATSPAGSATAAVTVIVNEHADEPNTTKINDTKTKQRHFDTKKFLNSLITTNDLDNSNSNRNSSHILDTLISDDLTNSTLDPIPEDLDFLGETSSAYTLDENYQDVYEEQDFDDNYDYNTNFDTSFHAALDLDDLKKGNGSVVSPPKDLKAVIVKHRFVTLSWGEPEKKSEEIKGFAVIYKVKGSDRERISTGSANKHEINIASLQPNTTYEFTVVAQTEHAVSPLSQSIEVHTPEEEFTYGTPLEVTAVPMGPHSIQLTWLPPEPAPQPPNYIVYYTDESNREQTSNILASPRGTYLTALLSGLRAHSQYRIRVSATGGVESGTLVANTPAAPPLLPPGNVTATGITHTSILVRWEAPPLRSHRGPLTGYKIRYRPAPGTNSRKKPGSLTTPADARRAELTGLDTGTNYQIRICAMNANGSGPFSEWVLAVTAARASSAHAPPPAPPPLHTRAGRDWVSVWWGDSLDEESTSLGGYSLGWGVGVPDEHTRDLPAHTTGHIVRGLKPNSEYVISLRGSNALGLGPPVYATVRTKPELDEGDEEDEEEMEDLEEDEEEVEVPPLLPPVGVKVIMLSGNTAVVYWTDPSLPKGQTPTDGRRYVVRWGAAGSSRTKMYNATDRNCMLDDLKPYTVYEFAVKLIKGGRESAWSLLVSNRSLETAPSSSPRELRVTPAAPAHRAVELHWMHPAKPNGLITGYIIMYAVQRSEASDSWIAVSVPGDTVQTTIERLRPRTTYLFKIQAKNSRGLGPFCTPVAHTTASESGTGGASAAWLWASAGGACGVLALAAALAASLCCRRPSPPCHSTYQKSAATAAIKPPDLWIHHDQMELKQMDKPPNSSNMSACSTEGIVSSTLTLGHSAQYEPTRPVPASLDRRQYVPTYVERRSPSCAASDDTAVMRDSPHDWGVSMGGPGCAATCDRRPHRPCMDQSTPLVSMVGPLGSPHSSMASIPCPPSNSACGTASCPLGAACTDIYATAARERRHDARERGHYVAYEPLGQYTHRDSTGSPPPSCLTSSSAGTVGAVGAGGTATMTSRRALCSFDSGSDRSTPCKPSGAETSPYKHSANASPAHLHNRLQLGANVPHCPEELEPLTPSRSTERLHREMQNLEGLMKDLSAITQQHQFHC